MTDFHDITEKRRILIQKLLCYENISYDSIKDLSVSELHKKWKDVYFHLHPHNGCGSLKWKKSR